MIDKHGYKMFGLKKASGQTEDYGFYSPEYVSIHYDRSTGEVLTNFHCALGETEWTQYDDPKVVFICNAHRHMTMQQIADEIADRLAEIEDREFWQEIDICEAAQWEE